MTLPLLTGLAAAAALAGAGAGEGAARTEAAPPPAVVDCEGCPPLVRVPPVAPGLPPLYVARHELTWREYLLAVAEAGCKLPEQPTGARYPADLSALADDHPVNYVAPNDFGCYLGWLNGKTGRRYRLPTGAEWEHAARAGTSTRFPWGNVLGFGNAAVWNRFDRALLMPGVDTIRDPRILLGVKGHLLPMERFRPNAWGLYDVVGNVAEYVADQAPGPASCYRLQSQAFCRLQVSRGGSMATVSYRLGVGMIGYDYDFLNEEERWFSGSAQPPGYRIVRE